MKNIDYKSKSSSSIEFIKSTLVLSVLLALSLLFVSCDGFVNNVSDPINVINDDKLNNPDGVDFLATGVLARFADVHGQMILYAGGLSDELIFITGSFEPWQSIDWANIAGQNPLVPGNSWLQPMMNNVAVLLFYADSLAVRVNKYVTFSNSDKDLAIRKNALFTGHFYGAVSRFYWAAYWGLDPKDPNDNGGGVINLSAYIPASKMYENALTKLDSAYFYADDNQKKIINTFRARIYLNSGKFAQAKTATDNGLSQGDSPLQSLYNSSLANYWSNYAGPGYPNYFADYRFKKYIMDDPEESSRIPLTEWTVNLNGKDTVAYLQGKYANMTEPINFISWQENELIKAELAINSGDKAGGLSFINSVRSSHSIKILTDADVQAKFKGNYSDLIYQERDKELCFTGVRLNDERRLDRWHLDKNNSWKFLPISDNERRMNPNLKK